MDLIRSQSWRLDPQQCLKLIAEVIHVLYVQFSEGMCLYEMASVRFSALSVVNSHLNMTKNSENVITQTSNYHDWKMKFMRFQNIVSSPVARMTKCLTPPSIVVWASNICNLRPFRTPKQYSVDPCFMKAFQTSICNGLVSEIVNFCQFFEYSPKEMVDIVQCI